MSGKKAQIITAATQAFLQNGFSVSMDHVAEKAVVSNQTIYTHFKSKEALFTAIIKEKCNAFRLSSDELNAEMSLDNFLVFYAEKYLKHFLSRESISIYRLIVSQGEKFPVVAQTYYEEILESPLSFLQQYFEKQNALGSLYFPDSRLAAEQFCGMIRDALFNRFLFNGTEADDETIRHTGKKAAGVFLHGHNKMKYWAHH